MSGKALKINYYVGSTPNKPIVYVLTSMGGDLLIDTGIRETRAEVEEWLENSGYDIKWIFLTHGHFDHTYNAKYFKEKFGAKLIMHENDVGLYSRLDFPELIPTSTANEEAARMANKDMHEVDFPHCEVDIKLEDHDTDFLRTLGFDADIVMLPGHTAGSMGIKIGRVLYCGDACAAKGGDYFTSLFGFDLEKIYESEQKIFALNPLIIAPGHGKLIINEKAFPSSN
ncbi:MAG: MBL fold metallo-hydrolase [Clostridiales bacterium]|nr:MBL fold metallo-hydrolase [Candidatus Equinaster intestinalis]